MPVRALLSAVHEAKAQGLHVTELLVAFSGGLDSTALLASAADSRSLHGLPVRALHVDHGWSAESPRWAAFCEEAARALGVPCGVQRLEEGAPAGASREAWAREQRYAALRAAMSPGTLLLTAHHETDQAETFLLMALRGGGPRGLAGIAPARAFGPSLLARPFLDLSRSVLEQFVRARGLRWLEDPANADDNFDRNFLRTRVRPVLAERWPAATATLARSARWQRAVARQEALEEAALLEGTGPLEALPVAMLTDAPADRAARLLRSWIRARGVPVPPAAALQRLLDEALPAGSDRQPVIRWGDWALRRHRHALFLTAAVLPRPIELKSWRWTETLCLPGGRLNAVQGLGDGVALAAIRGKHLDVRARRGGERLLRVGDPHHRSLKHLWQCAGVPPWERGQTPLLYLEGNLVAVPGLGYAAETAANPDEPSVRFEWGPSFAPA